MQNYTDFGFVRVAAAVPQLALGDPHTNADSIAAIAAEAAEQGAQAVVFPELCITGYTCGDLFGQQLLLDTAKAALLQLARATKDTATILIVGLPLEVTSSLYNCAAVLQGGEILGIVPKTFIPNYKEFYEQRWFASASLCAAQTISIGDREVPMGSNLIFKTPTFSFGIEICEDLWAVEPPSTSLALAGAEIIFNLSASNDLIGKYAYIRSLVSSQAARTLTGYVYTSAGSGESSTDLVYSGKAIICEYGKILAEAERFAGGTQLIITEIDVEKLRTERRCRVSTDSFSQREGRHIAINASAPTLTEHTACLRRAYTPLPFVPQGAALDEHCYEAFSIQVAGLMRRLEHIQAQSAVIGISGGLDSTLALLVAIQAAERIGMPRKSIVGITMPGFGTTERTHTNAQKLMDALGVSQREIPIHAAVMQHFADIEHDASIHDVVYENAQARERTQILMDIANQTNGIVIGTGDMSELALGWTTFNGDQMSMYGVNSGIPKTLVRHLIRWIADSDHIQLPHTVKDTLYDIIDTPISPELLPADEQGNITQKTEDLVGPYELHDFFLYHTLRHGYSPAKIFFLACHAFDEQQYPAPTIKQWLSVFYRRFFSQQYKRSCLPDAPKVGSVGISPRGDWRMPSDAHSTAWLSAAASHPDNFHS